MFAAGLKFNPKSRTLGEEIIEVFEARRDWWTSNYHERWLNLFKMYQSYRDINPVDPMRSAIFVPITFAAVDSELPRHINSLFATDPPFHALPDLGTMEWEVKGAAVENVINRWFHMGNRLRSASFACTDAMIYGLGVEKVGWEIRRNGKGDTLRDMPVTRRISPFNVFPDPTKVDPDELDPMHREFVRFSEIEAACKAGTAGFKRGALEKISPSGSGATDDSLGAHFDKINISSPRQMADRMIRPDDFWVELVEYCDGDWIYTVDRTSKTVLCVKENFIGTSPWLFWPYKQYGEYLVGQGLVRNMAGVQRAMNNTWNAEMDNMLQAVHQMKYYDSRIKLNKQDLRPEPNKHIPIDVPTGSSLREVIVDRSSSPPFQGSREFMDRAYDLAERISGQSAYTQGSSPPRQETYGGIALMIQEANKRYWLENVRWGEECVARSAQIYYLMARRWQQNAVRVSMSTQNNPNDVLAKIFPPDQGNGQTDADGNPIVEVGRGFMDSVSDEAFRFVATGSSGLAVREYQQKQTADLRMMLAQDPFIGVTPNGPPPTADPQQVMLHMNMLIQSVQQYEVANKEQIIRNVRSAYKAYMDRIQAAQQAPPPEAQPPQPEAGAPPPEGQPPAPAPPPGQGAAPPVQLPLIPPNAPIPPEEMGPAKAPPQPPMPPIMMEPMTPADEIMQMLQ